MHFFSPVHRIPLVEVIRAGSTGDVAVATAVEMARAMGKTAIVVADGPGFYTTRVLGFMAQEAGRLFGEGASIEDIDGAMTAFGFPVGPLALTDEVGIDVAAHVGQILRAAFPTRFAGADAIDTMLSAGRLGRKNKKGFYDYGGKKKKPDPAVYAYRDVQPRSFSRDLIQRRLALSFVNEAARCLEEGVLASARDGDVGAVLGIGFPPYLGGPFRHADHLGASHLVEQLKQMHYAYGPGFEPAGILKEMARTEERFYP
jgi:3-hydroxyacyl-CoA dehydrogenase/enoyl-CoA hydratase/3-hydroxybutyryl-CoA epimerase